MPSEAMKAWRREPTQDEWDGIFGSAKPLETKDKESIPGDHPGEGLHPVHPDAG